MSQYDDDLEHILTGGDFDNEAVIATPGGDLTVKGWFTEPTDATVMYNVEIEAQKPTFMCQTSDITTVRNKMAVIINGSTYQIERIEKIGTGMSVIYLKT
jgi:hypothetical protein